MKTVEKLTLLLVGLVMVMALVLSQSILWPKMSERKNDTTLTVHHVYDTTIHLMSEHKIIGKTRDSVVYVVPEMDSTSMNQIFQSWFTHYIETQTFRDSLLEATIRDSIGQNRILSRQLSYKILRPDTVKTQVIHTSDPKSGIYPGLGVCWGITNPVFGPALIYRYDNLAIQAGAGIGKSPVLTFGLYYRIKSARQ